tara:strand:+ start:10277 stop:10891 length:615 start_codon:yes stop_codon:yes gene_type:complete
MIKYISFCERLILCFLLLTTVTFANPKYVQISNQKQTEYDQIVIYEFFWYGCPHCFNLEPTMNQIEADLDKDTVLIKIPVSLRDTWQNHAKAYFALKQMNLDDDLHDKLFEEIHIKAQRLDTKDSLSQFVSNNGYNAKKFEELFDSFGTEIRMNKASRLARKYQINSVPTLVINGKYMTSGSYVSSYDELVDVVNLLVEKERQN